MVRQLLWLEVMRKASAELIYGLVTACEWDSLGNPIKVKISTDKEEDYYVIEHDVNLRLLGFLKSWVEVRGRVLKSQVKKMIDIEEVKLKIGGTE